MKFIRPIQYMGNFIFVLTIIQGVMCLTLYQEQATNINLLPLGIALIIVSFVGLAVMILATLGIANLYKTKWLD